MTNRDGNMAHVSVGFMQLSSLWITSDRKTSSTHVSIQLKCIHRIKWTNLNGKINAVQ